MRTWAGTLREEAGGRRHEAKKTRHQTLHIRVFYCLLLHISLHWAVPGLGWLATTGLTLGLPDPLTPQLIPLMAILMAFCEEIILCAAI